MSGYYNSRQYSGSITKKPKMMQRGPQSMPGGNPSGDDNDKRLVSFKEFMSTQSNDINEQEALARYSELKTDFTRRQIEKFFKEHQEEEWFRNKYRPTEIKKIEEALKESKAKRKDLYNMFVEKNLPEEFLLDYEHEQPLSQFLENFSLLLEGASLEDLENKEACKSYSVSSIYIPSLHPSIDKAMIEEYASTHPGFLRVAMSEVHPDGGFKRRAWVTYKQMDPDSLRKLSWEYNAHKFNGQETKVNINKEMNNRVRFAQFWFRHVTAAKSDIKNVAKLLTHFEGEDCPLLESIKEYLIEETNEEERILGVSEQDNAEFEFTQDPEVMKALDRVILYLRLVHSFDYYACTEYSGEEDMPQKIGIMFVRPKLTCTIGDSPRKDLHDFIAAQKARIEAFLEKPTISEIEQKQLGKKNADEQVESFIFNHTQEKKAGEKYICKLTKKRFTAPEYVRKHIFNRCGDKLDEVRTDVEFFNNYIADPRRPL